MWFHCVVRYYNHRDHTRDSRMLPDLQPGWAILMHARKRQAFANPGFRSPFSSFSHISLISQSGRLGTWWPPRDPLVPPHPWASLVGKGKGVGSLEFWSRCPPRCCRPRPRRARSLPPATSPPVIAGERTTPTFLRGKRQHSAVPFRFFWCR